MWQQWTSMILGVWVALIPFLGFGESRGFALTLMVSGTVIALTSAWTIITREEEPTERELQNSPLW